MERGPNTVLVIPITACLDVVYATEPAIDICEFNDAQFTIAPRCGTRPSSLYVVFAIQH